MTDVLRPRCSPSHVVTISPSRRGIKDQAIVSHTTLPCEYPVEVQADILPPKRWRVAAFSQRVTHARSFQNLLCLYVFSIARALCGLNAAFWTQTLSFCEHQSLRYLFILIKIHIPGYRLRGLEMMRSLLASDLYLLKRWDAFPQLHPIDRRNEILKEYLALGIAGRWPYHQAAKFDEKQPSQAQFSSILGPSRTLKEREIALILLCGQLHPRRVWLRTAYEGGNLLESLDISEIGDATGQDTGNALVLNDAACYSYGHQWQQILRCVPEIVDSYLAPQDPDKHQARLQDAKDEVQSELENEEDEGARAEIREHVQHAWVTGCLWVQDEVTAETGEALLVWADEFGRVVKQNRIEDVTLYNGMFDKHADAETEWWSTAEFGKTYEGGRWP